MDTLVALGAAAAFVYSTYALFAMTGAQAAGIPWQRWGISMTFTSSLLR